MIMQTDNHITFCFISKPSCHSLFFSPTKVLYSASFKAVPWPHSCSIICHKIPDTFLNCELCRSPAYTFCSAVWEMPFSSGSQTHSSASLNFDQFICIFGMSKHLIYLPLFIAFIGKQTMLSLFFFWNSKQQTDQIQGWLMGREVFDSIVLVTAA